jgi:hypothetical protein
MRICLPLFLLLCCCCCACVCARVARAHLLLDSREVITTHAGFPGEDVFFWLRWDIDYVGLFPTVGLSSDSQSYSERYSSDVFCFSKECIRLPFQYIGGNPSYQSSGLFPRLSIEGHSGVLGLASGSPLRRYYPWVRYGANEVELLPTRPPPRPGALLPLSNGMFPARLFSSRVFLAVALQQDLTLAPARFFAEKGGAWRLELYQRKSAVSFAKRLVLQIERKQYHVHDVLTNDVGIVTTATDVLFSSMTAASTLVSAEWNASTTIVVGRLLAQQMFDIVVGPQDEVLWLEPASALHPTVEELDYIFFLPAFLLLMVVWLLGMYEDVVVAERTSCLLVDDDASGRLALPRGIDDPRRAQTLVSFKQAGFVSALHYATGVALISFVLLSTMGFGFRFSLSPFDNNAYDLAAYYSTVAMIVALVGVGGALDAHPIVGVMYGGAAIFYAVWLMIMVRPLGVVKMVILFVATAIPTVTITYVWLRIVTRTMWPPQRYYATVERFLVWVVLATVVELWAGWLFAGYTVPYIIRHWRPAHPTPVAVGMMCLLLAAILAVGWYISHTFSMSVYRLLMINRLILKLAEVHAEQQAKRQQLKQQAQQKQVASALLASRHAFTLEKSTDAAERPVASALSTKQSRAELVFALNHGGY